MNYLIIFAYFFAVVLIKLQYEKYHTITGKLDNCRSKSLQDIIGETVVIGLASGFTGSGILLALGITIDAQAVSYLFMSICILSLFNLRFACISYSAGIIALSSMFLGFPKTDVPSLLGLAAVLQLIESILIFFLGSRDSIPVFIKYKGELTGAYMIRKFWPVPVVFCATFLNSAAYTGNYIKIELNSLFTPENIKTSALALGLDCIVAILCYNDLAISSVPRKKARAAGSMFFVYSVILLLLSILAIRIDWIAAAGAVFCIAGHEAVILFGRHRESRKRALFTPARRGLKILEVLEGSHAEKMGLQAGYTILGINGNDIQTMDGVNEALRNYPVFTWIDIIDNEGRQGCCEYRCYPSGYNDLGIVSVPRDNEVTYNTDFFENLSIIRNIVKKFRDANGSA